MKSGSCARTAPGPQPRPNPNPLHPPQQPDDHTCCAASAWSMVQMVRCRALAVQQGLCIQSYLQCIHAQPLRHFACGTASPFLCAAAFSTASTFLCAAACTILRFAAGSLFLGAAACTTIRFAAASRPASTTSALEGCRTCRASSVNHAGVQMHQTATPENMVLSLPPVSLAHQERKKREGGKPVSRCCHV